MSYKFNQGETNLSFKQGIRCLLAVGSMWTLSANAVLITFDSTLDAAGLPTTTVAGATVVDFSSGCGAYSSCVGNGKIVVGSSSQYAAPGHLDENNPYYTVPENLNQNILSVDFGLPTAANYFGLFWGSIDTYNTLSFLMNGSTVASFSGLDITNPANGNQSAPSTNTYVNFFDLPTFNGVRFTSTNYAFESDNHAFTSVPEPGTLGLLATGLIGLAARRRRKS